MAPKTQSRMEYNKSNPAKPKTWLERIGESYANSIPSRGGVFQSKPEETATLTPVEMTPAVGLPKTQQKPVPVYTQSGHPAGITMNPAVALPRQNQPSSPPTRPPAGPMTSIYASRIRQRPDISAGGEAGINKTIISSMGGGQGAMNEYNQGRTPEARSSALRGIWSAGGVPVIGAGKERAQVQDARGVSGVFGTRGVDTGIVAGSPEAQARDMAMASRGPSSGVYGSQTAPYARLEPLRKSQTRGGVFTKEAPVKTTALSPEEVKFRQEVALQQMKNEGDLATARVGQEGLNRREEMAAQQKMTEAQQKEAAESARVEAIKQSDAQAPKIEVGDGGVGYYVYTQNGVPKRDKFSDQEQANYAFANKYKEVLAKEADKDELAWWGQTGMNKDGVPAIPAIEIKTGRTVLIPPRDLGAVTTLGRNPIYQDVMTTPFYNNMFSDEVKKALGQTPV